jgi:hypothetical protein
VSKNLDTSTFLASVNFMGTKLCLNDKTGQIFAQTWVSVQVLNNRCCMRLLDAFCPLNHIGFLLSRRGMWDKG